MSEVTEYQLPVASAEVLGGIKVGRNLTVDAEGTLHGLPRVVEAMHVNSVLGIADVAKSGSFYDLKDKPDLTPYKLPAATVESLGGVIVGDGLAIRDGRLSVKGLTVDPSSVYTVQTFNHYTPAAATPGKCVYVLTAMYPLRITSKDIAVTLEDAFSTDMTIQLEKTDTQVGLITLRGGARRGTVELDTLMLEMGQQLKFRIQTPVDVTQLRGWASGHGMTIAIRAGQLNK